MPMRVRLPLAEASEGLCPIVGAEPAALWCVRRRWPCRDAALAITILAPEPVALPDPDPALPAASALASALAAAQPRGALLVLDNPAEAFGPERIAWAAGVRLLAIASPEDEACWDALLSQGRPCYAVRGTLWVEVWRPRPANVLSALSFGAFVACDGLEPLAVEESPRHIAWRMAEAVAAEVVVRGGFVAARLAGAEGRYDDRGQEGYVRVVLRGAHGACWTQPRFVAPPAHG